MTGGLRVSDEMVWIFFFLSLSFFPSLYPFPLPLVGNGGREEKVTTDVDDPWVDQSLRGVEDPPSLY